MKILNWFAATRGKAMATYDWYCWYPWLGLRWAAKVLFAPCVITVILLAQDARNPAAAQSQMDQLREDINKMDQEFAHFRNDVTSQLTRIQVDLAVIRSSNEDHKRAYDAEVEHRKDHEDGDRETSAADYGQLVLLVLLLGDRGRTWVKGQH